MNPSPTPREELLSLQKQTFSRLMADIRLSQGQESKELRRYRKQYEREVQSYKRYSSRSDLSEVLAKSHIAYCGDFHTLGQSQRTVLRCLRPLVETDRDVFLALEMVHQSAEKFANDFLEGKITEAEYLKLTEYERRWGFPWPHYRQLFDFCRAHRIRILALNSDFGDQIPLSARDDLASDLITKATLEHPQALIFCLYGDLHIASPHIPDKVRVRLKKFGERREMATIFQNSEPIYWNLAEKGLEHKIDVLDLGRRRFCVLSAAPWIKWQSYQTWLDDHSDLLDDPEQELIPDYYHQILDLSEQIADFLRVTPPELEHFNIQTASSEAIVDALRPFYETNVASTPLRRDLIKTELIENGSFLFPQTFMIFLFDISQNRAAEKASQLVAAKLSRGFRVFKGSNPRELFYRLSLWEAVGFLGSKVINPKRKCNQPSDFQGFLEKRKGRRLSGLELEQREVSRNLLRQFEYEKKRLAGQSARFPSRVLSQNPRIFFRSASAQGKILADQLYELMIVGKVSFSVLQKLFLDLPSKEGESGEKVYWDIRKVLASFPEKLPRSKDDRF